LRLRQARAPVGFATAVWFSLPVVACHERTPLPTEASPAPSAVASAPVAPSVLAEVSEAIASADLRVEARRGIARGPDAFLARQQRELEKHFGGPAPYPLAFQAVATGNGRTAVLLQATSGEARPLVWLVDSEGALAWTKDHPIGGVKPGVTEPALAPGPDGHVSLSWCNGSTSSVALRLWAEDGGAFADYEALHFDACDALSILYWPRRGWVLAVAWAGGLTLQLVSENGELRWGRDGMPLPWTWRGPAAASLALDTPDSMLLFRFGESGGAGSPEYVFASRFAPDGRAMWPGPLSVKKLPSRLLDPRTRIGVEPGTDGAVRAGVAGEAFGAKEGVVVEVASDGAVTRR